MDHQIENLDTNAYGETLSSTASAPASSFQDGDRAAPSNPLIIPKGSTDSLLDNQIASCAGLIEHIARYIARDDTPVDACATFMDRIASLMNSSAGVGKIIDRLRGNDPKKPVTA